MTRWILTFGFAAAVFGGVAASGCNSGADCTTSTPMCPSTQPSYKSDVAPLMEKYCTSCHSAGGQQSSTPLDTYADLSKESNRVSGQISGCEMPPSEESQPTSAERDTILNWVACGAPDN